MKYKITADSSCNLTQLEDVAFSAVPLKIIAGEREFCDNRELDIDEMVGYLRTTSARSGTSCPNVGEWLDAFEGADVIFAVCITGALSGSYAAAMQAKAEYETANPGAHVTVIDSLSAGPEPQLIVEKLRELILQGLDGAEIEERIREYCGNTHLLFSLESLKNLANNGRVSHAVAKLAGLLGIRIIGKASDEGELQILHKCRGEKRMLSAIFTEMLDMGYNGGRVRVAHCFNKPAADSLRAEIIHDFPNADVQILPCGGLCSFYAERGGLMIGFEGARQ